LTRERPAGRRAAEQRDELAVSCAPLNPGVAAYHNAATVIRRRLINVRFAPESGPQRLITACRMSADSPENFWSPVQKDFCNNICHKPTYAAQQKAALLDHLVGKREQPIRELAGAARTAFLAKCKHEACRAQGRRIGWQAA
jgi:hypothetical protein